MIMVNPGPFKMKFKKKSILKTLFGVWGILILVKGCFSFFDNNDNQLELKNSQNLFDSISKYTGNFNGSVRMGNISGNSFAILKNGKKQGDDFQKIIRLRYQTFTPIIGSFNKLDETYVIENLKKIQSDSSSFPYTNNDKYVKTYIEGNFKGLKSILNDGPIENASGYGKIRFFIDSLNKKLEYHMDGEGDFDYYGEWGLGKNDHVEIKKIFIESISNNERDKILESYNTVEFISNNLKKDGEIYIYSLSKDLILKYSKIVKKKHPRIKNKVMYAWETKGVPISFSVKNISKLKLSVGVSYMETECLYPPIEDNGPNWSEFPLYSSLINNGRNRFYEDSSVKEKLIGQGEQYIFKAKLDFSYPVIHDSWQLTGNNNNHVTKEIFLNHILRDRRINNDKLISCPLFEFKSKDSDTDIWINNEEKIFLEIIE